MDARLYKKVRDLLDEGLSVREIHKKLSSHYSAKAIDRMISEYHKDESTAYDDDLIHYIESSLRRGKALPDIYDVLAKKGHAPFEINKAAMRANLGSSSLLDLFKGWQKYSYYQVLLFGSTFVLTVFYSYLFLIPLIISAIMFATSSIRSNKNTNKWKPQIRVIPGMYRVGYSCGYFGYNPLFGNYVKWWLMDPALVIMSVYLLLGITNFVMTSDTVFLSICITLALIGGYSAKLISKKKKY